MVRTKQTTLTRFIKDECANFDRHYQECLYRDLEGWATKEQVKALCKGGGQTTLTPDIAAKLASGWRLHIEDDDLCHIVGITHGQLRGWLQNNTRTTFILV
jgi:hypothetical protein